MLTLPDSLRGAFKDPMGPVYTDAERLLADAGDPIVAVGDVVTYHLRVAGRDPDVAVIDGKTEREAVSEEIAAVLNDDDRRIEVENDPATLSRAMLESLAEAVADPDPVVIYVTGEEDLATVPAILVAPEGASVVYGQPGEGMVLVDVTSESQARARGLLEKLDGDTAAALAVLGVVE